MGKVFDREETNVVTDSPIADFSIGQFVLYAKLLFVSAIKSFCGFFKIFGRDKGFSHIVEVSSCVNQYVDPKMEAGSDAYVYLCIPLLDPDFSNNRGFLLLDKIRMEETGQFMIGLIPFWCFFF